MRQLLEVTHVGVLQRVVSPPPCHLPTTTPKTRARARSLARPRVGSTAGKYFPVALGGGYLMVLITSGSGNSGNPATRKERTPGSLYSGTPTFRIKDPPVPCIGKENNPKQNKPPVQVISTNLKEGSGSMKEPAVFWAVSHLTCLKTKT